MLIGLLLIHDLRKQAMSKNSVLIAVVILCVFVILINVAGKEASVFNRRSNRKDRLSKKSLKEESSKPSNQYCQDSLLEKARPYFEDYYKKALAFNIIKLAYEQDLSQAKLHMLKDKYGSIPPPLISIGRLSAVTIMIAMKYVKNAKKTLLRKPNGKPLMRLPHCVDNVDMN